MASVAHFSLEQYELMVEAGAFSGKHHQRVELIRGEVREMTPIGARHAAAVAGLARMSVELLPAEKAIVHVQSTLKVPALESAPQPDLMWLRPKDYSRQHPEPEDVLLLIEVADSSLDFDTGEKAQLYAEAGIGDYWVVDLAGNCIEVFRDPQASGCRSRQTYRGEEAIRPLAFEDVILKPAGLLK